MDLLVLVQSIADFILSVVESLLIVINFLFSYIGMCVSIFAYFPPILTSFFMCSITLLVVKLLGGR